MVFGDYHAVESTAVDNLMIFLLEHLPPNAHLVVIGLTSREIGLRLHLSPHTIKRHTLNIYEKLGVHNRTAAVTTAKELGILT